MTQLSAKDLRATLDFVGEVHSFEDLDSFRTGILPGLGELVPSDLVGYNEVGGGEGPALVITYPEPMEPFAGEALARLAHQHPLICVQANGDDRTYKISDFLSHRQFRSLDLYQDLYRRIGAEDQIAFGLPGPLVIGVAMNRARRDFSERDRAVLDLVRPHMAQARARIVERMRTATLLAAFESAVEQAGSQVIALDRRGQIVAASGTAIELLQAYFPGGQGMSLPPVVADWLASGGEGPFAAPRPLSVSAERGRLIVRLAPSGVLDDPVLVLEEERAVEPPSLLRLGLTRRQAEVLALVAAGRSTEEIAADLFISPATVRKHYEHVYERLGVNSRADAVALARDAAAQA
ncbi:MAG: LuxR C-terminal-related transcriptional regulator [Solirubrobacterales bacterium]